MSEGVDGVSNTPHDRPPWENISSRARETPWDSIEVNGPRTQYSAEILAAGGRSHYQDVSTLLLDAALHRERVTDMVDTTYAAVHSLQGQGICFQRPETRERLIERGLHAIAQLRQQVRSRCALNCPVRSSPHTRRTPVRWPDTHVGDTPPLPQRPSETIVLVTHGGPVRGGYGSPSCTLKPTARWREAPHAAGLFAVPPTLNLSRSAPVLSASLHGVRSIGGSVGGTRSFR
jgi:hypothetical protein